MGQGQLLAVLAPLSLHSTYYFTSSLLLTAATQDRTNLLSCQNTVHFSLSFCKEFFG
jgi:hypothetical protein